MRLTFASSFSRSRSELVAASRERRACEIRDDQGRCEIVSAFSSFLVPRETAAASHSALERCLHNGGEMPLKGAT